jgi:hypothetical protein
MVEAVGRAAGRGAIERAFRGCDAVNRDLRAVPRYSRELMHLFLASEESRQLRQAMACRYIALTADSLRTGQLEGEIHTWVDATAVASAIYEHYTRIAESWALGEIDDAGFEAATRYGLGLLLLGVARGRARAGLERRLRLLQHRVSRMQRRRTPPRAPAAAGNKDSEAGAARRQR